ncbi:MAG TPA: DUF1629 domain-containing protein [Polyangiales bacterium]
MKQLPAYSLLRQDPAHDYWKVMGVHGMGPPDALQTGAPLATKFAEPMRVAIASWGTVYRDFMELPCPIVSTAMRRVLEQTGVDNIEYVAARLEMEFFDEPMEGYWVCNVIGTLSCVDREASSFEPGARPDGELRSFQIDPARAYGLGLFRLAEDPRLVVVSRRVRAALEAVTLRGLAFQDTDTYDGYPLRPPPASDA